MSVVAFTHLLLALSLAWAVFLKFRLRTAVKVRDELAEELRNERAVATQLRRRLSSLEKDHKLFVRIVREFPHLTRKLHGGVKARDVPGILLGILQRSFDTRQALVLLRRRKNEAEPGSEARYVVAAVAPEVATVKLGTEVTSGLGDLGYVAKTQRVVSRSDLEQETPFKASEGSLPEFAFELAGPMVFDEQTLGILALAGLRDSSVQAKSVLRLIAQMGAFALHNATAFSRMRHTADVDELTRAFNKRFSTRALGELVFEARQKPMPLAIFLFDIDHFKAYNDRNGHVEGDQLLRQLARLVRQNVREEDIFCRFGGEEFLLILPGTDTEQARQVAEKIRAAIASHPFRFAEHQPLGRLSISGGVASYPSSGLESRALMEAADQALYKAKRQGRDRVFVADSGFSSHEDSEMTERAG